MDAIAAAAMEQEQKKEFYHAYRPGMVKAWRDEQARAFLLVYYQIITINLVHGVPMFWKGNGNDK